MALIVMLIPCELQQIEILWRTDEMRQTKPTVMEEIMTGLDYFRYSLFEAVCTTYRYAENSMKVPEFPDPNSLKRTRSSFDSLRNCVLLAGGRERSFTLVQSIAK